MQHEHASRTALLIAAGLVLLHHDPKRSRLVSKTSADLCARVLENHSAQTRWFSKIVRQPWFRPIAKLIERITIPGILLHYAFRNKCISDLARSALADGLGQVVIVGAGFDPLSSELQRDFPTVEFSEIDHPATQRHKVRACAEIGMERVHFVAVDLNAAGLDREALIGSGFDRTKRTIWIAEGLLMYFPAYVVLSLIRTLSTLSPSRQRVCIYVYGKTPGPPNSIRFANQTC